MAFGRRYSTKNASSLYLITRRLISQRDVARVIGDCRDIRLLRRVYIC